MTSRKDQAQYLLGSGPKEFINVREMVAAFDNSPMGKARTEHLATPTGPRILVTVPNCPMEPTTPSLEPYGTDPLIRRRFALDNKQLFRALFHRDALLMTRNMFIYM